MVFGNPNAIIVDRNGFLFVAGTGYCRIQKFTSDGPFVSKWGRKGNGNRQFCYPEGIAVDSSGKFAAK
jgi:tripartite motif-containing protein 71